MTVEPPDWGSSATCIAILYTVHTLACDIDQDALDGEILLDPLCSTLSSISRLLDTYTIQSAQISPAMQSLRTLTPERTLASRQQSEIDSDHSHL